MWYVTFNPREDITVYELAMCLSFFGDLSKSKEISETWYKVITKYPETYLRHIQFRNF